MMLSDLWLTADTHFGHGNVIDFCSRPFNDADEMDEALIQNWNDYVRPKDHVWHLGDFTIGHKEDAVEAILRRLNGNIHVVLGNHDERSLARYGRRLETIGVLASLHPGIVERKWSGQHVTLAHYAMLTWNRAHRGAWMLHGHSHGSLPENERTFRMDVGVDAVARLLAEKHHPFVPDVRSQADYRPLNLDEVASVMSHRRFNPVDHHGAA